MFSEMTFEQRVVSYIEGKLAEGEHILQQKAVGKDSSYYRGDIYLPNGCHALGIPVRSIIEMKKRLQPDTLYMLYNLFLKNKGFWEAENFYVIYSDRHLFSKELLNQYKKYHKYHFYVLSEQELIKDQVLSNPVKPKLEKWEIKRSRLIMDAQYAFSEGHNTFFFGAGLGPDVNMPTWEELLGDLMMKAQKNSHSAIGFADYANIDKSCNHSSLIIGRYIESGFDNMDAFKKQMHASLYKNNPKPNSKLYEVITEAIKTKKVDQVITFNYDDLVETALMGAGVNVHSIFDRSHYSGPDFPIYHVHGMIPQIRKIDSTPVLSEKEYHTLYKESFHWSNVVQLQALASSTCFFIGLSMNDPNLRRLLDISSNGMDIMNKDSVTDRACHYAILERKPLNPSNPDSTKDEEHFNMQERMMEDLGINVIWYEHGKYVDIPNILRSII